MIKKKKVNPSLLKIDKKQFKKFKEEFDVLSPTISKEEYKNIIRIE